MRNGKRRATDGRNRYANRTSGRWREFGTEYRDLVGEETCDPFDDSADLLMRSRRVTGSRSVSAIWPTSSGLGISSENNESLLESFCAEIISG